MYDDFSPNNNSDTDTGGASSLAPQQLAQLLMAARAAQQVGQATALQNAGLENVAKHAAPAQASLATVLGPTDPFTARAFGLASGSGRQGSSVPPPDRVPAKAAAVLSAQQEQANQTSGNAPLSFPDLDKFRADPKDLKSKKAQACQMKIESAPHLNCRTPASTSVRIV
ncbi:MAG TPA: hypothetical protein VKL40_05095 [Candidatus Angelobacter sp.]|nr:hypothetical protein [Candidatus Angelobacter sp.]